MAVIAQANGRPHGAGEELASGADAAIVEHDVVAFVDPRDRLVAVGIEVEETEARFGGDHQPARRTETEGADGLGRPARLVDTGRRIEAVDRARPGIDPVEAALDGVPHRAFADPGFCVEHAGHLRHGSLPLRLEPTLHS